MSDEERRTILVTVGVLLLASLVRLGWEARPVPALFPPEPVSGALLEETRLAVEREERMRTPLGPGERLDPNRAPDVELARLPGIGPALAGRIVESRETLGPFTTGQDLLRVSGVGPATLARIEEFLDLSEPPPATGAVGTPGAGGASAVGTSVVGSSGVGTSGVWPDAWNLPGAGEASGGGRAPTPGGLLDLNRAGLVELETLPGIGPALAQRIVEHRARVGRFGTLEDLLEVSGIGPATLERLRPLARVDE